MKIVKIAIENLGPYIGVNQFDFSVRDPLKKVVLVGGKNGAGKTTLFNAIRVGLYGCRAYGFESENAKYMENIAKLINTTARIEKQGKAGVTISILIDDGKNDYVYTFERSWRLNLKSLREEIRVTRNGEVLSETEKSDFQSYLLQLIPPDMFRFYFFDGESISNFVFNGVKNTDFKNAFLKLCGLDTMELIYENFQRVSNSRKKDTSGAYDEYQNARSELKVIEDLLQSAVEQKEQLISEIAAIDDALAKCDADFVERGGITRAEYQSMQTQINKEEVRRDSARKWLKEAANDVLPFVMLKPQLEALKKQIETEDKIRASSTLFECLNNAEVRCNLCDVFTEEGVSVPFVLADRVISVLQNSMTVEDGKQILNLSKHEEMDVLAKIRSVQAFDTAKVYSAAADIDESLERVKQIRKKLDKSDESGSENYFEHKDGLLSEKSSALQKQLETERRIDTLTATKTAADSNLKKAQQKYEEFLKAKSVNDVTAKALLAFGDLQKRLYKKYIKDVESNFSICFSRLINKSDLIDGITIDDDLQVYPYKLKNFNRSNLIRSLNQDGKEALIEELGWSAYDTLIHDRDYAETIALPVIVKQQLSAGEKQIFIMALYQALASLNKVSVPYIIDTPFARIDTEHRQNILQNFFMDLKGQMIILSTDEEIVGSHKASIESVISDTYLLQHEDGHGTKILPDTYFPEV